MGPWILILQDTPSIHLVDHIAHKYLRMLSIMYRPRILLSAQRTFQSCFG